MLKIIESFRLRRQNKKFVQNWIRFQESKNNFETSWMNFHENNNVRH